MDNLNNMTGFEMLQTLSVLAMQDEYLEEFNEVYSQILERAKNTHDLSVLKKAQDLRWKQTEYLTQQWLREYRSEPQPKTKGWSLSDSWAGAQQ